MPCNTCNKSYSNSECEGCTYGTLNDLSYDLEELQDEFDHQEFLISSNAPKKLAHPYHYDDTDKIPF
jgi:hypothetical protein